MKKLLKWAAIVLAVLLAGTAITYFAVFYHHDRFGSYPSGGKLDPNQAAYDVTFYDLNLSLDFEEQTIKGWAGVHMSVVAPQIDEVFLDLTDHFSVRSVRDQSGEDLAFHHLDDRLKIKLSQTALEGENLQLRIAYDGRPMRAVYSPWLGGFSWSRDADDNHWIGLACQGEGGKIWFPCKDHPSDEPDSAAINITIPADYFCASNGLLEKVVPAGDGQSTYRWFTRYPINNYNISISIGKYEIVERQYVCEDSSIMPVYFYVLPQSLEGADQHIDMAVDMLKIYRKYFGEYPWFREKFAIVETEYLGMEHQSVNAYGNKYKYDSINGHPFDWLMLHEMGHEWWGNQVSVGDWRDFWIHEGICSYGEALYAREKGGEEAYHAKMAKTRKRISNNKPILPPGRNISTNDAYTGDIYSKGAYFMHSLRYVLGDSVFFPLLKTFASDSAYTLHQFVETEDLVSLVNERAGRDWSRLFWLYLETTDYPRVEMVDQGEGRYLLTIPNIDFQLPVEIETDSGIRRTWLWREPTEIRSAEKPVIDPNKWYLLEISEEGV